MDRIIKSCASTVKLVILASLSALIIYPIVLILFIPISIYRTAINYLVKKWDPKARQMISGLSAILSSKNPYIKPDFVLMIPLPLKSKVDRNQVINVINKQILSSNKFSELSHRIVKKFGYNFWYETEKITTAADHVHYLNPKYPEELVTRKQILEIEEQQIVRRPFPLNQSPWEILIVPNLFDETDSSNKSLIILRTHHCLMDGYTIINFLKTAAVKPWKENKVNKITDNLKTSKWKCLQNILVLLSTGPYQMLRQAVFNNDTSDFMKMVFLDQQKKNDQHLLASKDFWPRISLERLKNIKTLHNANVSSILVTLVMSATAQFIKKRWGTVEKNMYLQMAYPIPGHPGKPTNHWTTIRVPIVFEENDPVNTLKRNLKELEKIGNSIIPTLNFYLANFLGILPISLIPKAEDLTRQTIVLTNIPGPVGKEDIFGYMYDEIVMHAAIRNGTAFAFGCVSTDGKLGLNFGANSDLFRTDEDTDDINESLENTLRILETSTKRQEYDLARFTESPI